MHTVLNKIGTLTGIAIAALPIVALTVGFAHAQPTPIRVSDLNLSSPAQVAVVDQRIGRAASTFCDGYTDSRSMSAMAACKQGVRAEAMEKLSPVQRQPLAGALTIASR